MLRWYSELPTPSRCRIEPGYPLLSIPAVIIYIHSSQNPQPWEVFIITGRNQCVALFLQPIQTRKIAV
jgi:hypothetical protein